MKMRFISVMLLGFLVACQSQQDELETVDVLESKVPTSKDDEAEDEKETPLKNQIDLSEWDLVWEDEFDYADKELDENWVSQNGPSHHILCSRWRENAVVSNGVLELVNKKEQRGGQDWTSGNIWTKRKFKYGYFECRYKYAAVEATNNSFWLMTQGADPIEGKRFEIDINEGHFPNEVNTNIHNWGDVTVDDEGKKSHPSYSKTFSYGASPAYSLPLEIPVTTRKIRFTSTNQAHFHIREFRVYNDNNGQYPDPLSETADQDISGLVNYARANNVSIETSGFYNESVKSESIADGKVSTSWISQREGVKWITLEWQEDITVGCLQFINGWQQDGNWKSLISNYTIEYYDGTVWKQMSVMDVEEDSNFGKEYHTYGLEWDEENIIFYFDGKEIRREKNEFCYSETPIWLSLAIIPWAGEVTDKIDGTSMKVDWVRYYQKKK